MRNNSSCALILAFATHPLFAQVTPFKAFWAPVTDAERSLSSPVVDKNAGVEALFWRVHVLDEAHGDEFVRALHHYVRLKVFNEKGKAQVNTIDIPFGENTSIMYISGRTIKPDGTILELTKDSIHQRDLVRAPRRIRQKVKSFAMPGVEPGAIIEYNWTEVRNHPQLLYMRLQFQREYPVQKVSYYIKPLSQQYIAYRMGFRPFNCKPSPLKLDQDGYNVTTLENVPAFHEEQLMPPEPNVRPWVLVYYHDDDKRNPDKYWADVGKQGYRELKEALKLNNELRNAATTAVEGVPEADRVPALIRYIRKNFRNLYDRSVTDAERAKIFKQMPKSRLRTCAEVFKSGIGTADELNTLFAAFASEIGLDARPAFVANRNDLMFHPNLVERYFLDSIDMAVKTGETWKLYDVSARNLPANMISWQEEGVFALITDPKKPVFVEMPTSAPEASLSERTARLVLDADGGVEGDVTESFTGHTASERRSETDGESEGRQQERVKEQITTVYPQAEISAIQVVNADDPEKPFQLKYHVKIPGYAQRTGKRIFFQPLFFQRGAPPLFSAGDRQFNIDFRYAWKESDKVTIAMPAGFELDHPEAPGHINFGETGSYSVVMVVSPKREFVSTRVLIFGANGALFYPQNLYPNVKSVFDDVNRFDNKGISLKQTATVAAQ